MRLPITSSLLDNATTTNAPFIISADGEPFLIELQGSLETDASAPEEKHGQLIGQLDMSNPVKPVLYVGNHKLVGRIDTLPRPLAVLRHTFATTPPSALEGDDEEPAAKKGRPNDTLTTSSPETFRKSFQTPRHQALQTPTRPTSSSPLPPSPDTPVSIHQLTAGTHEIVTLLRKKIIFAKRPEPISIVKPEEFEEKTG